MIKKILLLFMCLIVLYACGRKADPEYQSHKNEIIHIL